MYYEAGWHILTPLDCVIGPLVAIVLYVIAFVRREKYEGTPIKKYFIPALTFRLVAALLSACMYQFYYNSGDTYHYYLGVQLIYQVFFINPMASLEAIFLEYANYSDITYDYIQYFFIERSNAESILIRISSFFGLFTFGSYLGISFCLSFLSFAGCWRIYRVFYDLYPSLHRELAIACLFIPSVIFWGVGIMKDSISVGFLGFTVYAFYEIAIKKQLRLGNIFFGVFSAYLLFRVKAYILLAILPAMLVWLFFHYRTQIKNTAIRKLSLPAFFVLSSVLGFGVLQFLGQFRTDYSLDNLLRKAAFTQDWIYKNSIRDQGSTYDIGTFEPTLRSTASFSPRAINVALFRPYIWEVRNLLMIPASLESILTFLFTLFVLLKVGVMRSLRLTITNPHIFFCLLFSLVFAFAVGLISGNFGTLARYKIPMLPFYFTGLVLLLEVGTGFFSKRKESQKLPKRRSHRVM